MEGDRPQLARLIVRCCLVDASPVGLPVRWPEGGPEPQADRWLAVEGVMGTETWKGQPRNRGDRANRAADPQAPPAPGAMSSAVVPAAGWRPGQKARTSADWRALGLALVQQFCW